MASQSSSALSPGATAAVVIIIVVGLAVVVVLAWRYRKRKFRHGYSVRADNAPIRNHEQPWHHGNIERGDAEDLLTRAGLVVCALAV